MRVDIKDSSTLQLLKPLDIAMYLFSKGWEEFDNIPNKLSYWKWQDNFLLLPYNSGSDEYALCVLDILKSLEQIENRSQVEIFKDIQTSTSDIVRIRANAPEAAEGSIPIEMGVELVKQAKEMVLAAACSEINPLPYYPSNKPRQAVAYLNNVKMGQTEQGSYVLPIISKLPLNRLGQTTLIADDPYERRVIKNLVQALNEVKFAATISESTGSMEVFRDSVRNGVSANLCEAIVGITSFENTYRDLELKISWSHKLPVKDDVPTGVFLQAQLMPIIEKASTYLKEFSPREDFIVHGPVLRLEKLKESELGKVTLVTTIDGESRYVWLELPERDYHLAIQAHDKNIIVKTKGTLVKEGKFYWLRNFLYFKIDEDEEQLKLDIS